MNRYEVSEILNQPKNYNQTGIKRIHFLLPRDLALLTFNNANDVNTFTLQTSKILHKIESDEVNASVSIKDNSISLDLDFLGLTPYYENLLKFIDSQDYLIPIIELVNGQTIFAGLYLDKTRPFARYKLSRLNIKKEIRSGLISDSSDVSKSKRQLETANKDLVFFVGNPILFELNNGTYLSASFTRSTEGVINNVTIVGIKYSIFDGEVAEETDIFNQSINTGIESSFFGDVTELIIKNAELTHLRISALENLYILDCRDNFLNELDISNLIILGNIRCDNNNLDVLDVSNLIKIASLICHNNNISVLDTTNLTLCNYLRCDNNNIQVLNTTNLINASFIFCGGNSISELDLSNTVKLTYLSCLSNNLDTTQLNNILFNLAAHGKSNGTLIMNNNAGTYTDTTSYNTLISRGWTITT